MADSNTGAEKYASNSNRDKQEAALPEKKVDKVIEGTAVQRKKSVWRRIGENLKGEDTQTVGQYLLFDVVLPQIKDLIYDIGSSALQRLLFGDRAGGGYKPSARKGYTPYNVISTGATPKAQQPGAPRPVSSVASDEFGEIVVDTRGGAQEVMDRMGNLIDTYGMASVSDLKACVGLTGNFTDEKWGWVTMGGTDIRRVGGQNPGFALVFPRPQELT